MAFTGKLNLILLSLKYQSCFWTLSPNVPTNQLQVTSWNYNVWKLPCFDDLLLTSEASGMVPLAGTQESNGPVYVGVDPYVKEKVGVA